MQPANPTYENTNIVLLVPAFIFSAVTSYGRFWSGATNSVCDIFGCYGGFFGYDALEHFLFGFAAVCIIVWLFEKFPRYSVLHEERLKSAFIVVSVAVLIAVGWEIGEFLYDAFLVDAMHQSLLALELKVNLLSQPNNFDTMGDLTLSLLGSLLALPLLRYR